jgi:hypothetical protein
MVRFTPRPLYPRSSSCSICCRGPAARPHSRYGRCRGVRVLAPPRIELRPLGRPARSQSLYRLSYAGSVTRTSDHVYSNRVCQNVAYAVKRHCSTHAEAPGSVGARGTMLQAGRSWGPSPTRSQHLPICLVLPTRRCPWGRFTLQQK